MGIKDGLLAFNNNNDVSDFSMILQLMIIANFHVMFTLCKRKVLSRPTAAGDLV
jgi:hypothetical protein